jgi:hypothetical protein
VIQGGLKRTADLPNVPLMQELVDDAQTEKIIEFITRASQTRTAEKTGSAICQPLQVIKIEATEMCSNITLVKPRQG